VQTTVRELVSGNRLTAFGAIDAGCRFFAGYPITPSSEIYHTMIQELPGRGGVALAAPDEISALAACVGASMAGHRAMTATSGPGFCLMVETVQYALMTETPVVIALVQRLGPSTGGATQGGQGDVLLAGLGATVGYPIPVFAPSDAVECYRLTCEAFRWSERLRTPAIVLSDKQVGMTLETVDVAALPHGEVPPRPAWTGGAFAPYRRSCPSEPPAFAAVGGCLKVVATGSAHDADGHLRRNDPEVIAILRGLAEKVTAHADEIAQVREDREPGATTLVVSWGISARAARQAVADLRRAGRKVSLFQPWTLFPLPLAKLAAALAGIDRVVVVEQNLGGHYAGVLEAHLGGRHLVRVAGLGSMIPPSAIVAACQEAS